MGPDPDEAAAGVQTQYRGADPLCLRGARLAWLRHRGPWPHVSVDDGGRGLDPAVGRRLCPRVGPPHEHGRGQAMSSRPRMRRVRPGGIALQRQMAFWLAALAVFILLLWLLSEILLPFIAGLAIAYLLTPLTDRLDTLGGHWM